MIRNFPIFGKTRIVKTAIVLGATGLTGGILLKYLLNDERYDRIKVFTRRHTGVTHPKLEEHVLNLFELEKAKEDFKADEVFCCVGTTKAKTPDLDIYRKVDYGIPLAAAKLARQNFIPIFLVISALGVDPDSRFFYNRIKGEMERDVLNEKVPNTYFFQPSLISGVRKEKRLFESISKKVMKVANHVLVGPLEKYRSIHPDQIARAIIKVANDGYPKTRIESDEIKTIAVG